MKAILILELTSLLSSLSSARRVKEISSLQPAGFVEQIALDIRFILDPSLEEILNRKASRLISDFHLKGTELDLAIERMRRIIWNMVKYNQRVKNKLSSLVQTELARREEREPLLNFADREEEEKNLFLWYGRMAYDILSRRFAQIMEEKIDTLLPKIQSREKEFFINLKEKIKEELLSVYIGGLESESKIPDKFWKAIRLATINGNFYLVRESLSGLFGMQGVKKNDILSVQVGILSKQVQREPSETTPSRGMGTYRYRVNIEEEGKVISTEFILKLFITHQKNFDELSEILSLIKELSPEFPQIIAAGAYIRDKVWTEDEPEPTPMFAFTQKSLLRKYIVTLTAMRERLEEEPETLIRLETAIIREFLRFWKETRREIGGEEKGLLISVWPGRVSVWQVGDNFEFRFLGIDHAYWLSFDEVLQELVAQGYQPRAILEARKGIIDL